MAAGSFQVGQRFELDNKRCRLIRALDDDLWQFEDVATGRIFEKPLPELLTLWKQGGLVFASDARSDRTVAAAEVNRKAFNRACEDAYRQSYPEMTWKRAQARLVFVERLKYVPLTKEMMQPIIQEVWEDKSIWKSGKFFDNVPSVSTVARWIRKHRVSGEDIRALISRDHDKGQKDKEFGHVVEEIIDDAIDLIYMTLERQNIQRVVDHVSGLIAKRNVDRLASDHFRTPSYASIKERISRIDAYDRWRARYGKRVADIKFRASGKVVLAEAPLARASMDHCRLDVFVVDDKTGLPLGRPWLTLLLDEATRCVLGYYIGFEEPSSVSVSRAIQCALMPKADLLAQYPQITSGWDAWGVMRDVIVDNGLEFHGEVIRAGAGRFGIAIQFTPRKKPWFKGKIERFFGTINTDLLIAIPGKTFSSILERDDYDPAKHAVLRLSTLKETVLTWIVDIYHNKPHRGMERAKPAQVWAESIRSVDRWLPQSSLAVDSAFSKSEKRRLTHKGIEHDCLFYNSADMQVLRKHYGAEIDVEVRVMDEDVGSIVVVSPDHRQLIRVPAVDQKYAAGLTRWQHAVCKRYQRRLLDDKSTVVTLFEAKERIRLLIQRDKEWIKRATRKRQARFEEKAEATTKSPAGNATPPQSTPPAPPPIDKASTETSATENGASQGSSASTPPVVHRHTAIPSFPTRRVATQ